MPSAALHAPVLDWYTQTARRLPWRQPETSPWAVLVSEVMLQQTPVARVLPAYERWLVRWPTPAALAADSAGAAVRQWGRLGYPRRALRLHQAATAIVADHAGRVPTDLEDLRRLPGVGAYTAAAVASFAFRQRHVVLDTNVRRVLTRAAAGAAMPPPRPTRAERERAEVLLPADAQTAATWNVAVMELGALVCTARSPNCARCPIAAQCRWRLADYPRREGGAAVPQRYAGTDRQCRGRLLDVLREADRPVPRAALTAVWDEAAQRERALDGLIADGLVELAGRETYQLPG